MADLRATTKRLQIDKANQKVMVILSVAVFVTIFCIFVGRVLVVKQSYQAKVIAGKEKAVKQLETNVKSVDALNTAYANFVAQPTNIIGGQTTGSGDRDGDNAKIILDALPSKYDFPALTASLEKLLKGYGFNSISGNDDEIKQAAVDSSAGNAPVPIPFTVSVKANFPSARAMLQSMENSIRPIQVGSLVINGTDDGLSVVVAGTTYYQPEKQLSITMQEVK